MAAERVNTLVAKWNASANLNLVGDQEQQLKALLTAAVERTAARRQAAREVFEKLAAAAQGNDGAAADELLKKVREGVRQAADARERFLDEFDKVLQPEQRARLVLALIQEAKQTGQAVEHFVDALFAQDASN